MQNLLLSQIKAAERIMTEIKSKLIDSEYKLQQNPKNQDVSNECRSFVNSLKEMVRDFDTLIQYSQTALSRTALDQELIKAAQASKSKVMYL